MIRLQQRVRTQHYRVRYHASISPETAFQLATAYVRATPSACCCVVTLTTIHPSLADGCVLSLPTSHGRYAGSDLYTAGSHQTSLCVYRAWWVTSRGDTNLYIYTQTRRMGTKTIGLREEVYERLKARKREDESFSDLVDRLVEERRTDWREGFGTLPDGAAEALGDAASASR